MRRAELCIVAIIFAVAISAAGAWLAQDRSWDSVRVRAANEVVQNVEYKVVEKEIGPETVDFVLHPVGTKGTFHWSIDRSCPLGRQYEILKAEEVFKVVYSDHRLPFFSQLIEQTECFLRPVVVNRSIASSGKGEKS